VVPLQADDATLVVADVAAPPPAGPTTRRFFRRRAGRLPWFSGGIIALFLLTGAIGPMLAPYDPEEIDLLNSLTPPMWFGGTSDHILGTDQLGRDILTRIIYGARVSLLVALAVVAIAGVVGITVAVLAGYRGGRLDAFLMRVTDATMAFPVILLMIVIVGVYGASTRNVIIILAFAGWASYARVLRSEVISVKTNDFVTMTKTMGGSSRWIIRRHILPNILPTVLVLVSLQLGLAIIAEGSLSFLGIGVPPPAPSWGGMLSEGRAYLTEAWWLPTFPGIALSLTVLASNMLGDWLRVFNDPTTRR
jgi:peptide/nickel transport system permease protein